MNKYINLTIAAVLLLTVGAFSQPKIGYLNPQNILDELPEKVEIENELNAFLDEKEAEFEEKAIEFHNARAELQQRIEGLSEAEARREQERIQFMNQELEDFQTQIERELHHRQSQLLQPILNEINIAIETVAKELELDYVLNETTGEGEMILIFVSSEGKENLDITQRVLNLMLN